YEQRPPMQRVNPPKSLRSWSKSSRRPLEPPFPGGRDATRGVFARLQALAGSDLFRTAFAALVFVAALWALQQELRESSLRQIGAAMRSTPIWVICAAGLATLVSYGGLAASERLA